jgi:hypothetical protein
MYGATSATPTNSSSEPAPICTSTDVASWPFANTP